MPSSFARTFRSLEVESEGRSRLMLLGAAIVLGAWSAWFFGARLSVYVTSDTARLEVTRATHPVDAPVGGRVVKLNLQLDQEIHEGDVLVELDPEVQQLDLAEANAKAGGIGPQLTAQKAQIAAEERALHDLEQQSHAAIDEQKSRVREAEVAQKLAVQEAERLEKLRTTNAVPEIDAIRKRADADQKIAAHAALRANLIRLQHQFHTDRDDRRARIASLTLAASKLEADLSAVHADIDKLTHNVNMRSIRAPASGRIGELGTVRLGTVVKEGDRIGTIVASGELKVVAQFPPAQALGRVQPGQSARVRFDGFPWTEYGDVTARVVDIAAEIRDEHARADLTIVKHSGRIPLQHGLPASVEVEVERTSPASLVLRAAGSLVKRAQPTPALPPPASGPGGA
jgi:membrane fusion protein (multidrug efflux system)